MKKCQLKYGLHSSKKVVKVKRKFVHECTGGWMEVRSGTVEEMVPTVQPTVWAVELDAVPVMEKHLTPHNFGWSFTEGMFHKGREGPISLGTKRWFARTTETKTRTRMKALDVTLQGFYKLIVNLVPVAHAKPGKTNRVFFGGTARTRIGQ